VSDGRLGRWHRPPLAMCPLWQPARVPLSVQIRQAAADDLGELITLQRAAFLAEAHIYGHPRMPPMLETVEEVRQVLGDPLVHVFVAEIDRPRPRIVGSVRARNDGVVTEVGRLATAPDLVGRGIGSRLLQQVHDLPEPTTEAFELYTGALSTANHRLYAAHGYLPDHTFVDAESIEVIVMRRPVLVNATGRPQPSVCVYVIDGDSLLVVQHREALAGVQVPAGPIRTGESVRLAVEREVRQTTGLSVRFARLLGYEDTSDPSTGEARRTAYTTAALIGDRPTDPWEPAPTSPEDDAGQVICGFAPLRQPGVGEDQTTFLSSVAGSIPG
jgi:ADP-ribose pyrophosphatase YjhB (NUDIX family)/GNAT superfamily N-acetyltransferase